MNNKELTESRLKIERVLGDNYQRNNTIINASAVIEELAELLIKTTQSNDEIKREAVEEFLKSQIEYEAEEYAVCPLCKRELIWGETYCPDDRRKLITETRNKLEWSNRNTVIKELIESLTQKENNE